jgi:hypothetical protein
MLDTDFVDKPRARVVEPESEHSDVGPAIRAPATALRPATVMGLQRTAGNAAVTALLQRKMAADEDQEEAASPVLDVVGKGAGEPLAADLKAEMETRLDNDFSDVRVHTDTEAADSAAAVSARAYTVGNEVVFGNDSPALDSDQGKRMLAHELTHVVQQRTGPVAGTPTGDGISISDPSDQFEHAAESTATRVMSDTQTAGAAAGSAPPAAQRALADEEEEAEQDSELVEPELAEEDLETAETEEEEASVQGLWVQRAPEDYTVGDQEEDEKEAETEEEARETEELSDELETKADESEGEDEDEAEEAEVAEDEAKAEADDEAQEAEEESE